MFSVILPAEYNLAMKHSEIRWNPEFQNPKLKRPDMAPRNTSSRAIAFRYIRKYLARCIPLGLAGKGSARLPDPPNFIRIS